MFKVLPWIFRMKTRTNFYFLRNDEEARERQTHPALCYFLGLPPVSWKGYLPSVNLPPSTCLAQVPHTGAYGSSHVAPSQGGSGVLVTWALFSSDVTAAVGSPENDRLSLLFVLLGKKSEGHRREMFSYTQQLWRDSIKEHIACWLSPLWTGAIEGKPLFLLLFFFLQLLVNCGRWKYVHPQNLWLRYPTWQGGMK